VEVFLCADERREFVSLFIALVGSSQKQLDTFDRHPSETVALAKVQERGWKMAVGLESLLYIWKLKRSDVSSCKKRKL